MTMTNPRPLFKQSAETVAVCNLMAKAKVGETVTYEAMREAVRSPINIETLRGAITSARRTLLRDKSMVFDAIPGVGYVRLAAVEIVDASDRDARQIRRKAQRAIGKLAAADPAELPPETQGKLAARVAVFSAVSGWFDVGRKLALPSSGPASTVPSVKDSIRGILG